MSPVEMSREKNDMNTNLKLIVICEGVKVFTFHLTEHCLKIIILICNADNVSQ